MIPDGCLDGIEAEIRRLRNQKDTHARSVSELQTVFEFNEDLFDGSLGIFKILYNGDGDLADQLLEDSDDLVEYFEAHANYLVVAPLEENAQAPMSTLSE